MRAGPQRRAQLGEAACVDPLPGGADDVLGHDRALDRATGCGAHRRARGPRRRVGLAQPHADPAVLVEPTEVQVRLGDVALEPPVAQLVVEAVAVHVQPQVAAAARRERLQVLVAVGQL